ncbi:MAG: class I SAM-dependent methyltransferase [Candidatus Paceibacterota bacterium]|jgi:SAM-dependent methyltransferase
MSKNKIDNKKIYDDNWADWVDMKIYGPASRWLRGLIGEHLCLINTENISSVLDVGSGEGTITYYIAKHFPEAEVTGIDFSQSGINCASEAYNLPNLDFIQDEDSTHLKNKYDLVAAYEVLEHVEDWEGLLGRMADASNKYIMLSFPVGRMRSFEKIVGHLRNFKKGEVENFLSGKGFRPVNIFYAGFPFYNPVYRELCNLTNSAGNSFTKGKYGWGQKITASVFYFLFRYCSTKYFLGNQFCGLFERI